MQQDSELVQTLTRLCKEREEKVAKLEQELNALVINKDPLHASGMSSKLVDKATITDTCFTRNISSPVIEFQSSGQDDIASSNKGPPPRRRRVVNSSGTSPLSPTPPRSGPGALSRYLLINLLISYNFLHCYRVFAPVCGQVEVFQGLPQNQVALTQ